MRSRNSLPMLVLALAQLYAVAGPVMHADAQTTQGVVIVPVPSTAPAPVVVAPAQPQPVYAQPTYAPVYAQPAPTARAHSGPNIGLIVSGSVMLGVGWILNFLIGIGAGTDPFSSHSQPEWDTFRGTSFIPIAGPWVQLAVKPNGFTDDMWGGWLILDGLIQGAGTILLIAGIATSGGDDEATADQGGVRWTLVPTAGPEHAGLSVLGSF
jgi:hypothetical protein